MNSRLICRLASVLSCHNASAKTCIRTAARASFSSAAKASAKPAKNIKADFDMGKLVKPLEAEIEFNSKFIEGEGLKVEKVSEAHTKFLNDQGWTVTAKPSTTVVELTTERDGLQVMIRFDAELVAQSINTGQQEFEDEEETEDSEEQEEFDADELDEDDEIGPQPFNFTLELRRSNALPNKFVEMEIEAIPGPISGNQSADEVYINSIAIRNEGLADQGETYAGPEYTTLDEDLRSAFDSFASKNLRGLVPFISEYSQAKEAQEYGTWLKELKTFAQSSN